MGNQKATPEKAKASPIAKVRAGSMSVSVWNNTGKKGDQEFTFQTVSLQRSYKDAEGEWQNPSLSLRVTDLPKAILALQKAYETCVLSNQDEDVEADE